MKKIVIIIFSLALVVLVTFGIIKVKNKNVQGSTNNVQVETAEEIKQTEDKVKQQEIVDNTKVEVSDIPVEVNENKAEDKGVTQENATQPVEQVHTQYHEEKAAKTSTKKENTKVEQTQSKTEQVQEEKQEQNPSTSTFTIDVDESKKYEIYNQDIDEQWAHKSETIKLTEEQLKAMNFNY